MPHFRTTSDYQWEIGSMLDRGLAVDAIQWQLEREGVPEDRVRWLIKSVKRGRFDRRLTRTAIAALVVIVISIFANSLVHGTAYDSLERLTGLCIAVSALILITWLYRAIFRAEEFDWDPRGIIPPHVAAPPPRDVIRKKRRSSRQKRFWLIYICLIAGIVLVAGVSSVENSFALTRRGVETQGQIINYRGSEANDYEAKYRYRYVAAREMTLEQSRDVTHRFHDDHPRGSMITVTYLPENALISVPSPRATITILPQELRPWQWGIGAFLLASLLLAIVAGRRSVDTDFMLGRYGVAQVADVDGYYVGRRGYRLNYVFEVAGKTYVRQALLPRPPSFQPQRHDRVVVLYDPNNPNRNWPLDALNVEICARPSSADSHRTTAAASETG